MVTSAMINRVVKRSLTIRGHKTSISLEQPFWDVLKQIAQERSLSMAALVTGIDTGRGENNLSSTLRVYALQAVQSKVRD
jgi:predicted DNA-binding ribbon-helix-helix protein